MISIYVQIVSEISFFVAIKVGKGFYNEFILNECNGRLNI